MAKFPPTEERTIAVAVFPPAPAVMITRPGDTGSTSPVDDTVALLGSLDVQATPVTAAPAGPAAVSCTEEPAGTLTESGAIVRLATVVVPPVSVSLPRHPANITVAPRSAKDARA